jgi:hypothetical protein
MLLPDDETMLAREELSEILQLSPAVVNALVASGALQTRRRDGHDVVDAAQVEKVFRDSLLRLYYAQASRAAAAAAAHPPPEAEVELELDLPAAEDVREPEEEVDLPVILRTSDEHLVRQLAESGPDLRLGLRYVPRRQIGGMFREVRFTILQLSNSGLRIRHSEKLSPGEEARVSIALQNPPRSFVMRGQVVWTSIAQRGDEPSFYISGLMMVTNADRLAAAADLLRNARELQVDDEDRRRTRGGDVPRPMSGLPDEDVVAIIRAVRRFAADPTEASRWYARARFAVADEEIRKAAPRGARERDEVLGVWEYLQRRIDLKAVASVVQWIRHSNVAAV